MWSPGGVDGRLRPPSEPPPARRIAPAAPALAPSIWQRELSSQRPWSKGSHILSQPLHGQASDAPGSPTDPGQRGLFADSLDAFQLGLDAIQARRGLVVLVPGVGEVLSHDGEGVAKLVDVAAEPGESRLDLPRVLLDGETSEPEDDHLQIRVEAVGRDGDDVASH